MNLLAALLKPRAPTAPRAAPDSLPILRENYSPALLYVIPRVRDERTGEILHLDRAAARYTRAALLGPAGLGKTSALSFLGGGATVLSLADFHPSALPSNPDNPSLILLDEVEPLHSEYLATLAREYPAARILVAARHVRGLPQEYVPLTLQSFNEREMISAVEAWFPGAATGHGGVKLANRAVEACVAALKADAGTRLLATNPLYLFLLLQIYQEPSAATDLHAAQGVKPLKQSATAHATSPFDPPVRAAVSALPSRRAELFDAYLNARLQSEEDPDFAARALEGIALSTRRGQIAKAEHLPRGYGFLRERPQAVPGHNSGRVGFVHELLHDLLAARALRRNPDLTPLLEHYGDENWREVVLFYAGLGDARALVEALLERDDWDLGARALAETAEPPADLLKRVTDTLIKRVWEQQDMGALQSLGALRSNAATDFFSARLKERDPQLRQRAAQILGQLQTERALEYLLPQLRDTNADVRDQVVASLGQSKSDRVIEPLLVALRGDPRVGSVDTRMRVAAARALGEFGTEKAVPALIVDLQVGEPEVCAEAAAALIKIRSDLARKPLQAIVSSNQKDQVRAAAQQVLDAMEGGL